MKNLFSIVFSCFAAVLLSGCVSNQLEVPAESQACMNYRSMMTAPMAPDAMQHLKQACEDSQRAVD